MPRCIRVSFAAFLLLAAPLRATDLSTMVEPGWLHYSLEPRFELQRTTGARGLSLLTERYTLPLVLEYGLVEGTEGVLELPVVRYGSSSIDKDDSLATGLGSTLSSFGFGDLALGFKYHLLEDNGHTPSLFFQPLLKLPSGSSSLEAYARTQAGESVERGTGSGSLDLETSLILSSFADPVENYIQLTYAMRGSDDRVVHGADNHVDYGARMELLGGLAADVGANWSFALESLAAVTQASQWRVDGIDMQALKSAQWQSFRAATLAQSNINLSSTMEWYVGPKIGYRFARGFAAALRVEAGLSPDSLPLRAGLELSGAFRPGNLLARFKRLKAKGPDEIAQAKQDNAAMDAEEGIDAEDQERGNLQRYLSRRLKLAEKAADEPAWDRAADELGRLLEMASLSPGFKERLTDLQLRLLATSDKAYQSGLADLGVGGPSAAAKSWKDLPRYLRGLDPGDADVKAFRTKLQAKAQELHHQGLDLYVKDKTHEALELWNAAALLDPSDKSVPRDIERARDKLKALK